MDGFTTPPTSPINQPPMIAQPQLAPIIHHPVAILVNPQPFNAFLNYAFGQPPGLDRPRGPASDFSWEPIGPWNEAVPDGLDRKRKFPWD